MELSTLVSWVFTAAGFLVALNVIIFVILIVIYLFILLFRLARFIIVMTSHVFNFLKMLRLVDVVAYCLITSISLIFSDWVITHKRLVLIGLFVLIGMSLLTRVFDLMKYIIIRVREKRQTKRDYEQKAKFINWQIEKALEMKILANMYQAEDCLVKDNGIVIHPLTEEPILPYSLNDML